MWMLSHNACFISLVSAPSSKLNLIHLQTQQEKNWIMPFLPEAKSVTLHFYTCLSDFLEGFISSMVMIVNPFIQRDTLPTPHCHSTQTQFWRHLQQTKHTKFSWNMFHEVIHEIRYLRRGTNRLSYLKVSHAMPQLMNDLLECCFDTSFIYPTKFTEELLWKFLCATHCARCWGYNTVKGKDFNVAMVS